MDVITNILTTIANFFSNLFTIIVSVLNIVVSLLTNALYLVITIIPCVIKIISLAINILPRQIVPFFVISITIAMIKFIVFHSSGLSRNREKTTSESITEIDKNGKTKTTNITKTYNPKTKHTDTVKSHS